MGDIKPNTAQARSGALQEFRESVWQLVATIPSGRVATYGQIATLAGAPQQSRLVGRILSRLPTDTRLPWYRVINAQGKISNPNLDRQQQLLVQDGIEVKSQRVRLRTYQWSP
ncbi:MAG: methylated-DNA-protein-cysteine methyltransferase-like protein [Candidatus Pseudothioglobus sp.]|jgi:methylated-DNA-protein-cysteine methyltransferase-like protein